MSELNLKDLCESAMDLGRNMDLSDCHYGDTDGSAGFIARPTRYYYFLAGFVKLLRLSQILEIGTNSGGSIMSLSKGIYEEDIRNSQLVTIDITNKNEEGFQKYSNIARIQGDSLDPDVIKKTIRLFEKGIDVLYIDSLHEYEHTKKNIDVYAKLNPRYIILDDIKQNDAMIKLWQELELKFGEDIFDVSEIIKRHGAGFGVINFRK